MEDRVKRREIGGSSRLGSAYHGTTKPLETRVKPRESYTKY